MLTNTTEFLLAGDPGGFWMPDAPHSIPPRVVPAIIEFAFGDLAREPHRVGKPLKRELAGLFGARRGPYRLLHRIDDEALRVYIVQVDHRVDVYRPQ